MAVGNERTDRQIDFDSVRWQLCECDNGIPGRSRREEGGRAEEEGKNGERR